MRLARFALERIRVLSRLFSRDFSSVAKLVLVVVLAGVGSALHDCRRRDVQGEDCETSHDFDQECVVKVGVPYLDQNPRYQYGDSGPDGNDDSVAPRKSRDLVTGISRQDVSSCSRWYSRLVL
jgi:hypothetical protein